MAAGGHSAYRGSLFWNITYEFQRAFSTEFNHLLPLSCVKKVRLVSKEILMGKQEATCGF